MSYVCVSVSQPDKEVYLKTEGLRIEDALNETGNIAMSYGGTRPSYRYVYRKMGMEEFKSAIEMQELPPPLGRNTATAEKWVSESLHHTRQFENKGVHGAPQATAEIALDRRGYSDFREHSIPQRGSKAHQPSEGRLYNVTNKEHLETHRAGKMNIGIKGRHNLDEFNKSVVKIQKVNEHGFMNKNNYLRWIRRHKMAAVASLLSVTIDVASVTLSVIDDGGKFGPSTTINISEIGVGLAGSVIGAAILSFIPIVGAIVGGLIGNIIGNLIGKGIAYLIFGVRSVAKGPGPPLLDTEPEPTGVPSMGLQTGAFGEPSMGTETGAFGEPSMGTETGAFGFPSAGYRTGK